MISKNLGEINEVLLKAFLVKKFINDEVFAPNLGISKITSLRFSDSQDIFIWEKSYESKLKKRDYLFFKGKFKKAPQNYKADIEINGIKYSVKYKNAAKSAIVNHTSRLGFLRVCNELGIKIEVLDKMINEYWQKRISGIITEDIKNNNPISPFGKNKEYLAPILEYFLFKGTGSGPSDFQADKVLVFEDPYDVNTYKILEPNEIVNQIWNDLVFSIRSKKGMPKKYQQEKHSVLTPWVRQLNNDTDHPKGALHVRY